MEFLKKNSVAGIFLLLMAGLNLFPAAMSFASMAPVQLKKEPSPLQNPVPGGYRHGSCWANASLQTLYAGLRSQLPKIYAHTTSQQDDKITQALIRNLKRYNEWNNSKHYFNNSWALEFEHSSESNEGEHRAHGSIVDDLPSW